MLKKENIFRNIRSDQDLQEAAIEVFRFQYSNNSVYSRWTNLLGVQPKAVKSIDRIPFLPVEFFKEFEVLSAARSAADIVFTSSSTTSQVPSRHIVTDISLYEESFSACFRDFYGAPGDYCIIALLPNYLQRGGSSLVYMCDRLIRSSGHPQSGFFLDDPEALIKVLNDLKRSGQKTLLIGVSYALMDLCDAGVVLDENFTVMETGGMKGRRKELLKPELHAYLKKGFRLNVIHSEYGMTEMLSQAYSRGDGLFDPPSWLRFLVREVDDPMTFRRDGKTGGVNVIDLANINSCSFIATKDLGRLHPGNRLELMGRYDHSDVRGCNLMLGEF